MTQPNTEIAGISQQMLSPSSSSSGAKGSSSSTTGSLGSILKSLASSGGSIPSFGSLPGVDAGPGVSGDKPTVKTNVPLTKSQKTKLAAQVGNDEDKQQGALIRAILKGDESFGPYTKEQLLSARAIAIGQGSFGTVSTIKGVRR